MAREWKEQAKQEKHWVETGRWISEASPPLRDFQWSTGILPLPNAMTPCQREFSIFTYYGGEREANRLECEESNREECEESDPWAQATPPQTTPHPPPTPPPGWKRWTPPRAPSPLPTIQETSAAQDALEASLNQPHRMSPDGGPYIEKPRRSPPAPPSKASCASHPSSSSDAPPPPPPATPLPTRTAVPPPPATTGVPPPEIHSDSGSLHDRGQQLAKWRHDRKDPVPAGVAKWRHDATGSNWWASGGWWHEWRDGWSDRGGSAADRPWGPSWGDGQR